MSNTNEYKFEGWLCKDKNCIKGEMEWGTYEPKHFEDDDIDIKIMFCGVCGSDAHEAGSQWFDLGDLYPCVVGHEIVGKVIKIGSRVTNVKVGDIVGVGAQSDSCMECDECKANEEPYCANNCTTYCARYKRQPNSKGDKSYGGYAKYHRVPAHFAIPIPQGLDPAKAAPLLCAGSTVYSPLVRYGAGSTKKDVGVIGIGGLGHIAVAMARAMGANVTAISHSDSKAADAQLLGATNFLATHGRDDAFKGHERSLDLILATTNDRSMPLNGYLSLLRPHGVLVLLGVSGDPLPPIDALPFVLSNIHIAGSAIGSPQTIKAMFDLAVKHQIEPWIEKRPMSKANETLVDLVASKARYRYVLVADE
ncbi:hypothetical protein OIO90_002797 [Microbotryomycetes sp. JL221]|nr:hypothetical protein OIO90_002797 [Microbotryomycetes sp. JL221]